MAGNPVKPPSGPTSGPGSAAAVRGASLLIGLQVGSRAATFVANQLLLRFLTAQLLGVATQLEVYYLSVLFFARESLRVAIQRQGGRAAASASASASAAATSGQKLKGRDDEDNVDATASQSAVNLAYVSVLLGAAVAALLGWLFYLAAVRGSAGADGDTDADADVAGTPAATPYFFLSLGLYAVAAVVELLSEPAFVVLQLRLQFGARARAESVATVLRCAVTLGAAVAGSRMGGGGSGGGQPGVLPFALGQLAYGGGLLAVYAWYGAALAARDGFSLLPRRLTAAQPSLRSNNNNNNNNGPASDEDNQTSTYALALFDRATLHLASSMAAQSIVKHVLTQGDTFLVSVLSTPTAQGVYALANNYGGLAARLLFQPVEESSRSYFSRLLAGNKADSSSSSPSFSSPSAARASRDLQILLKLYLLFALVVTALGPAAVAPFLALVTGPRWAASRAVASATLAAYVWYLPLLAVNGVAEAFSAWMGAFSLVFAGAGFVCLRLLDGGAVGLVAANALNMACRIAWCTWFIRRYFAVRGVRFAVTDLAPHPLAVAAAVVASQAVQRLLLRATTTGSDATNAVAQITQLATIAAQAP
ncbi:diphthamide biosynthesis protein [Niveomyces insectorum RCEF 264]|uniref:Man(5)GlcNAc(2)-PP-dolichol translocation protein RFT1 n=1 Tax=Niveomyces insectorum RCEF 264 TaxID=1081102 RepID=A0A162MAV0_9HYPO|nr:diphthamide biosynthesis protein [Niveomyces insectorum RCEF 264]